MKKTRCSIYLALFFLMMVTSFSSPNILCSAQRDTAPLLFVRHKKIVINKAKLLRTQLIKTLTTLEHQLTYWQAQFYTSRVKKERTTIQNNVAALELEWNHSAEHFGQLNRRIMILETEKDPKLQDALVQDIMHIIAHCLTKKAPQKKGFIRTPSSFFKNINNNLINTYSDTVIRSCEKYLIPNFIERNWKKGLVAGTAVCILFFLIYKNQETIYKKIEEIKNFYSTDVVTSINNLKAVLHKNRPPWPKVESPKVIRRNAERLYDEMTKALQERSVDENSWGSYITTIGKKYQPPTDLSPEDTEIIQSFYEGGGYPLLKQKYRMFMLKAQKAMVDASVMTDEYTDVGNYWQEVFWAFLPVVKLGMMASAIPFTLLTGYLTYRIVKTPHFPYYAKDLRFIFRDIDRLLTQHAGKNEIISDAAHGELLYRVQKIRTIAHAKISSPEKEQFLEDLHDLSSPSLTGDQGLAIIERIFRSYQFLSFTPINVA